MGTVRLFALAVAVAVLSTVFLIPVAPAGRWGVGIIFGLVAAFMVFVLVRNWASVSIRADQVVRERHYGHHWVTYKWPYPSIERCIIVPSEASRNEFSVMILTTEDDILAIGIPRKIDVRQVGQYIAARGVRVTYAQSVPKAAFTPHTIPPVAVRSTFVAAAVLFLAGPILGLRTFGQPPDAPAPPRPGADVGEIALPMMPPFIRRPAEVPPAANPFGDPAIHQGFDVGPPVAAPKPPMRRRIGGPAMRSWRFTDVLGGAGGAPFESAQLGRAVLGFQFRLGSWAGQPALADFQPMYNRQPQGPQQVVAREGYAVGALEVDAAQYVTAVRAVFMRIDVQGRLDPKDSYQSEWMGTPSGKPTRTLGGDGAKVIGICGRRVAVLDAVGLVLE